MCVHNSHYTLCAAYTVYGRKYAHLQIACGTLLIPFVFHIHFGIKVYSFSRALPSLSMPTDSMLMHTQTSNIPHIRAHTGEFGWTVGRMTKTKMTQWCENRGYGSRLRVRGIETSALTVVSQLKRTRCTCHAYTIYVYNLHT